MRQNLLDEMRFSDPVAGLCVLVSVLVRRFFQILQEAAWYVIQRRHA
jgi:hypothetical protein